MTPRTMLLGRGGFQHDEKGEHRVTAYAKCTLKSAERHYFTSEKKILAIVYCLNKFRSYLVGQYFEISSDNQALSFLLNYKLSNARMPK